MTKQELKRYVRMNIELKQLEEQIERLEAQITSPKITQLEHTPKGKSQTDLADKIAKLVELKALYNKKWDELIDEKVKIEKAINNLKDPTERAVIWYRYIGGLTWREVAKQLKKPVNTIKGRIHARALQKIK